MAPARDGGAAASTASNGAFWREAISGATAGMVTTLALQPLDVVKTRLQGARAASSASASSDVILPPAPRARCRAPPSCRHLLTRDPGRSAAKESVDTGPRRAR